MKINDNFVMRKVREEFFLVPYKKNEISSDVIFLNSVGSQVFRLASECLNASILTENVAELFQVQQDEEAKGEIREFIDQMLILGLLVEGENDGKSK
nr:hypothetical protein [uncultured Blautia sp.]